jgi:hypothetical protein
MCGAGLLAMCTWAGGLSRVLADVARHDLYGDFVEVLVSLMREGRLEKPPHRRASAKR